MSQIVLHGKTRILQNITNSLGGKNNIYTVYGSIVKLITLQKCTLRILKALKSPEVKKQASGERSISQTSLASNHFSQNIC